MASTTPAETLAPTFTGPDSGGSYTKTDVQYVVGAAAQSFFCTCSGLKPSTAHTVSFMGSAVKTVTTNSSGQCNFTVVFAPLKTKFKTIKVDGGTVIALVSAGSLKVTVKSADGSSSAAGNVLIKKAP